MTIAEIIEAARAAHPFTPNTYDVGRRIQTIRPDEHGVDAITIHEMISNFDGEFGVMVGDELMAVTPVWRDAQSEAVRLSRA